MLKRHETGGSRRRAPASTSRLHHFTTLGMATVMTAGVLVATAGPALAAGTYRTTGVVNVRSGPGTGYGVVATAANGASFTLICQWQNGTPVNGNATWDRVQLANGTVGAIADWWTTTPSFNSFAPNTPNCNTPAPTPPPPVASPWHTVGVAAFVRTAPARSAASVGSLPAGSAVNIQCQAYGETVSGVAGAPGTSMIWDRISFQNGTYWLSDLMVRETTNARFDPRLPQCPSTPGAGGLPASARNIGYNPFAANFANQCTFYAEERMHGRTGRYMPVYGHAYLWGTQARAGGWTVGTTAAVNSVAVFPAGAFTSPVGHVAWVIGLGAGTVHIQDFNWGGSGARMTDHWVAIPAGTQFIYSDR